MKKIALAILMSLTLVGCANEDIYGGNVYSGAQAKEARSISYGTIVSTRPVKIQSDNQGVVGTIGGGAIGGIAGSTIGGGTGRALATAVGAVAGIFGYRFMQERTQQLAAIEAGTADLSLAELQRQKEELEDLIAAQAASEK